MSAPHIDDGALVRLLDGETTAAERASLTTHLASCDACADRQARLAALSGVAAAAVTSVARTATPTVAWSDVQRRAATARPLPRPRARAAARWRVAAALLVAAGAAAAAPNATRWLRTRLAPPASTHVPAPAPSAAAAASRPTTSVAFVPATDVLTIAFDAPHPGASLELVRASGAATEAEVIGAAAGARLLVLPSELRVHGGDADRAVAVRYRVSVPPRVRRVRVEIAGRGVADVSTSELRAAPLRIELAR